MPPTSAIHPASDILCPCCPSHSCRLSPHGGFHDEFSFIKGHAPPARIVGQLSGEHEDLAEYFRCSSAFLGGIGGGLGCGRPPAAAAAGIYRRCPPPLSVPPPLPAAATPPVSPPSVPVTPSLLSLPSLGCSVTGNATMSAIIGLDDWFLLTPRGAADWACAVS